MGSKKLNTQRKKPRSQPKGSKRKMLVLLTQLQGCENSGEFSLHKRSPFCGIMMWNHIFTVWHGYTRLHGSRAAARWSRYKSYQVQLTDEQTQGKPHAQAGENINI